MINKFVLVVLGLALFHTSAQASPAVVRDIVNLSRSVENAANVSGIPEENLVAARDKLKEVLDLLSGTDPGNPGNPGTPDCVDFAYNKYYETFPSQQATDKAVAACKIIADMNVVQYLFDKHYAELTAGAAMDKAASQSGQAVRGKIQIITFAFDAYFQDLTSSASATKAATNAARVSTKALSCLQSLYNKYFESLTAAASMDKAFDGCANQ